MLLAGLLALSGSPARAHGDWRVGADWVPLGTAAIVDAVEGSTSGTGAGEFDGVLRPPLAPWIGRDGPRWGWAGSVGLAASREATWTADDARVASVGAVRPALDLRRRLPPAGQPALWAEGGAYLDLPWVADRADGYSDEEAALARDAARELRRELFGVGLRAGLAAEVDILPGLAVGLRVSGVLHQGGWIGGAEAAWTLRSYVEGALRVAITPGARPAP